MARKWARERAARGMATATRVVGGKKGNGGSNKEGNGNQRQQHEQLLWQKGLQASDGANDGNGDGDGMKDTAACTTTGESRVVVAMGHALCVCRTRAKLFMYPRASIRCPLCSDRWVFWR
jgi:hypothetical protein